MDGHAAGIDGGDARGRHDNRVFAALRFEAAEKSRLARAGFAGQEDVPAGLGHVLERQLQLWIRSVLHVLFC